MSDPLHKLRPLRFGSRHSQRETAASGYAAETEQVFIYDRIETQPLHRRRGLGKAVMSLLRSAKTQVALPEVLVATEDGRKLYEALGWRTLSPYSTACIPGAP